MHFSCNSNKMEVSLLIANGCYLIKLRFEHFTCFIAHTVCWMNVCVQPLKRYAVINDVQ